MNKNCKKKKQLVISGVCGFGDKTITEISFLRVVSNTAKIIPVTISEIF